MNKVVFTFQGAFGPPTYGHYKSMEAFINRIITDYNTNVSEYIFMFMPTKQSTSKPHLEPTTKHRINILNLFCEKLSNTIDRPPGKTITIISSDIEINYTKSSATINTIAAIKEEYIPKLKDDENLKIIIGMGQDNAYQLPYWERIEDYKKDVDKIYLVKRDPGTEVTTRSFKGNDGRTELGTFDAKVPGWANKPSNLDKVFNNIAYKEGTDVLAKDVTIKIAIPVIEEIATSIPPSSSSLIRYFIKKYSIIEAQKEELEEARKEELEKELEKLEKELEEIRTNIKKLIFGPEPVDKDEKEKEKEEELVNTVIDDYKTHGLLQYIPDEHEKYNEEYLNYENYLLTSMTKGGGKKKRSSKKRTMKKKRKSKKGNYSKKNRRKSTRKRGGNSNDINNYHNINKKT